MRDFLRNLTLIERMIVVAIIGIFVAVIAGGGASTAGGGGLSFGYNGAVETRCINGYSFVVGQDGGARQVLDDHGKGARC